MNKDRVTSAAGQRQGCRFHTLEIPRQDAKPPRLKRSMIQWRTTFCRTGFLGIPWSLCFSPHAPEYGKRVLQSRVHAPPCPTVPIFHSSIIPFPVILGLFSSRNFLNRYSRRNSGGCASCHKLMKRRILCSANNVEMRFRTLRPSV